jgi:hypothetical protein
MLKRASKYVFTGMASSVLLFLLLGSDRAQATTLTYHFTTQQLINGINAVGVPPDASQAVFFDFFIQPVLNATLTNFTLISATSPIPAGIDMYQTSINVDTAPGGAGTNYARYFIGASNTKIAYVSTNANVTGKTYTIGGTTPAINGQTAEIMPLANDWAFTFSTTNAITPTTSLTFAWTLLGHNINPDGTLIAGKNSTRTFNITEAEIPEPSTITLFGAGLLSVCGLRFWRSSKRAS